MSRFDVADPSTDPVRCDALSDEPPYACVWCGELCDDDTHAPYCSPECKDAEDEVCGFGSLTHD
jgi:hypothetical protein